MSGHSGVRVAFPCGWNAWGTDGAGQIFGCDRGLGLFAARVLASPPASWCRLLSRPLSVCTLPSRAQEPSPSWTPSHSASVLSPGARRDYPFGQAAALISAGTTSPSCPRRELPDAAPLPRPPNPRGCAGRLGEVT